VAGTRKVGTLTWPPARCSSCAAAWKSSVLPPVHDLSTCGLHNHQLGSQQKPVAGTPSSNERVAAPPPVHDLQREIIHSWRAHRSLLLMMPCRLDALPCSTTFLGVKMSELEAWNYLCEPVS